MKNGFTLMELLGVIVILSLLILLIVPNILDQVSNKEGEVNEAYQEAAEAAAQLYLDTHPRAAGDCVPITDLDLDTATKEALGREYSNSGVNISDNGASFEFTEDGCS